MAKLHRRQLSYSSSQISVFCIIFLPDFSFTIEENLLEITMKSTLYRFLKICHQKNNYFLEIVTGLKLQLFVCVLCWGVVFNKGVFFAGTPFARRK